MALIPVFYTASTKDVAEKSHNQGILKYPGICWIQDIETVVYVSSDNELHYAKGNEQIDKVIDAVSGHLPALNDDGSLVDSGKSVDDFEVAGAAAETAKNEVLKYIGTLSDEYEDVISYIKDISADSKAYTDEKISELEDLWVHVTYVRNNNEYEYTKDVSFETIDTYYKSHTVNDIFISYEWFSNTYNGILRKANPGYSYEFIVWKSINENIAITIYKNERIELSPKALDNIPYIDDSDDDYINFGNAVCRILGRAPIGVVSTGDGMSNKSYLVVNISFDRGRGTCLIGDAKTGFKRYSYNSSNMTIEPSSYVIKNPNPNKLILTGGAEAEYDGTSEVTVDIPEPYIFDVSESGDIPHIADSSVTFSVIKEKAEATPTNVYLRFRGILYPLNYVADIGAQISFRGFDYELFLNSDNSITIETIYYMDSLVGTITKNDDGTYSIDATFGYMLENECGIAYFFMGDDNSPQQYLLIGATYNESEEKNIQSVKYIGIDGNTITLITFELNGTLVNPPTVTVEQKPIVPDTLPNPNALTFSGLVEGNYDGSEAVNIEIPQDMWIHINKGIRDFTFEEIDNYYKSHPDNNIFICYTETIGDNDIERKGILEAADPGNSYMFGVWGFSDNNNSTNIITKSIITISKDDRISFNNQDSIVPTIWTNSVMTFENAVCTLLSNNDCGIVHASNSSGYDTYLVIKTHFDRGYGTCIISSSDTSFKAYAYNLRDMTIAPYTPNIISITREDGKYKSSLWFSAIKEISPENMLVCYNNAYGRLVSMDDDKAVFKILKSTVVPFDVHISINSDNSVEVKPGIPSAYLNKNDDDTYVLNLSNTFMNDEFVIDYYDDATQSSYSGRYYKSINNQTTFRIWLSETEIMDVAVDFSTINDDTDLSAVPVTVEKKALGSNSFIVKVTPTYSNSGTTYSSDHSFSEIEEAYNNGLNPIVMYDNYVICQMVRINLLEAEFVSPSSSNRSYNIVIDKNSVTVDEFNIITSDKVIPDLDNVLDALDPVYPREYPVSAQAIGKLRDSIKESIPTQLSQLESRDYDSLENKPIVSINDLIDGDKFTYTETKPNAQGFVTRTYKFIINPDLDFNDRLFRVDVPDNVGSIIILIVTKKTDGSNYLTYYIMGAANGEILAINTNKANKMMVVNRIFTGSRMLIEFDDTGCYKNSTSYFSIYKSDVLTKTNTVEFTPTEDYHPATKKYVDDTCEEYSSTVRVEKTSSDTTAEIEPNKLYVFPEMASLTYTLATPEDTSIANEYHFVFRSGATATELVNPSDVNVPDGFTVDANKVYEVSILEGCMTYQSWAVS